jgi:hypothetical protein
MTYRSKISGWSQASPILLPRAEETVALPALDTHSCFSETRFFYPGMGAPLEETWRGPLYGNLVPLSPLLSPQNEGYFTTVPRQAS